MANVNLQIRVYHSTRQWFDYLWEFRSRPYGRAAVLIDLYDTLIRVKPGVRESMHAQMAEMLSIDANRLAQEWESTTYDSNVGGIVDTSARFAVILERLGVTGDVDVGKLAQMEHDMLLENIELGPWAAEFLIQLRRRGYKVGLVSNCSPSVNWALNASGLRSHFDCEVLSYQIRAVKPDPRIYDHALSLLNCQAQEAYFLGDGNNGELSAAESCGITPIEVTWASGGRELPSVSNWKRVSDFRMAAELIDEEARWTFSR